MNPYQILYYILYKFIKTTTKDSQQDQVKNSTDALFFICLTQNFTMLLILTNLIRLFPSNKFLFGLIFSIVPITMYFFNKWYFTEDDKYLQIENKFDQKLNISKVTFILLSMFYILLTIGGMITAGINFNK